MKNPFLTPVEERLIETETNPVHIVHACSPGDNQMNDNDNENGNVIYLRAKQLIEKNDTEGLLALLTPEQRADFDQQWEHSENRRKWESIASPKPSSNDSLRISEDVADEWRARDGRAGLVLNIIRQSVATTKKEKGPE